MAAVARNPWLAIPLADYEAHMALPQVGQAELLANVLADVVRLHTPRSVAPVELAYAGLLFEYVEPAVALRRLAAKLLPGAVLVAVLQLPSAAQAEVTPSPYTSLAMLAPSMRLVPPAALTSAALAEGYESSGGAVATASGGKRFAVQTYRRR